MQPAQPSQHHHTSTHAMHSAAERQTLTVLGGQLAGHRLRLHHVLQAGLAAAPLALLHLCGAGSNVRVMKIGPQVGWRTLASHSRRTADRLVSCVEHSHCLALPPKVPTRMLSVGRRCRAASRGAPGSCQESRGPWECLLRWMAASRIN